MKWKVMPDPDVYMNAICDSRMYGGSVLDSEGKWWGNNFATDLPLPAEYIDTETGRVICIDPYDREFANLHGEFPRYDMELLPPLFLFGNDGIEITELKGT
jgi:hypothetical protein